MFLSSIVTCALPILQQSCRHGIYQNDLTHQGLSEVQWLEHPTGIRKFMGSNDAEPLDEWVRDGPLEK